MVSIKEPVVIVNLKEVAELLNEFPGESKYIKNQVDYWGEKFNQKPFEERVREVFLDKIKKPLMFINTSVEEEIENPKLRDYIKKLHKWLYFTDEEVIELQLAALIGEKLPGDPIWLLIVAPPGASKTETLRPFIVSDDFFPLSDLTSRTFVSGLMVGKGKNRKKIEDLLPQLNKKVLIFKDFTTILEKGKEERQEIFAQLREIYDGSFSKKFGTIDKTIRYKSRFGLLAGVTPIVDKHWKMMQQLGERFLKVRWNEDIDKVTTRAREIEGEEKKMRQQLSKVAMNFMEGIDFSKIPKFDDEKYGSDLDKIAKFVAIARTPVVIRDYRSDFYFDYIPTPERPTRLVKQFKKFAKALALIRGRFEVNDRDIETIRRIAKDTVPQDRLKILEAIGKYEKNNFNGCPRPIIYREVLMPESSIKRVLEQLKMLELIKTVTTQEENQYGAYAQTYYYKITECSRYVLYPPKSTVGGSLKREVYTKEQL